MDDLLGVLQLRGAFGDVELCRLLAEQRFDVGIVAIGVSAATALAKACRDGKAELRLARSSHHQPLGPDLVERLSQVMGIVAVE